MANFFTQTRRQIFIQQISILGGGGSLVSKAGSCLRGPGFDSSSIQTFSEDPAVLKSVQCEHTGKNVCRKR